MKKNFSLFIAVGISAISLRAAHADAPVATLAPSMAATGASAAPADSQRATAVSPWRDKGVLSTDEIIALLGVTVTADQRAELDRAVAQRNLALQSANAQFSAAIQAALKTDDAALTQQMAAEKERQRLELMRRRQPSRYEALKAKNKKK